MFCPKCGTKNPETGKFCRSCGTDLNVVSEALSGAGESGISGQETNHGSRKKKKNGWDQAFTELFMGIAFLAVSIILSTTEMGRAWWFWLLIPAFGMLGSGASKFFQIKQAEKERKALTGDLPSSANRIDREPEKIADSAPAALPAQKTEFVGDFSASKYQTGDLVPPSVVEETTRHLKADSEGETMTLPKDKA